MEIIKGILIFLVIFMAICAVLSAFIVFFLIKGLEKFISFVKRRKKGCVKISEG